MTINKENDTILESVLRKLIIMVVVLALILPLITPKVFAAAGVTISVGDNIKGGDTFTVTVTYGGGSVGRVSGQMEYDTSKLTYLSGGNSTGNTGYVQLKEAGTGDAIVFNVKFQAVSEGSTELRVTTDETFNLDEEYIDNPSASKTISIAGNADNDELITETASPDQPVDSTKAKGVDEKPEASVSPTMVLIIAAAVVAVLIVIIAAILIGKKKKERKTVTKKNSLDMDDFDESFEMTGGSKNENANESKKTEAFITEDRYETGAELRNDDVKYDSNGNIARRSQLAKDKASKKKDSRSKAAKKKLSSEDTELWDDWGGWDDNEK